MPIQLTQSMPHIFNIYPRSPFINTNSNDNLPEEFNRPSSLAGKAVEEARDEESHSNVQFTNLKCSICLCNPTTDTRLDCTIFGKLFFFFIIYLFIIYI